MTRCLSHILFCLWNQSTFLSSSFNSLPCEPWPRITTNDSPCPWHMLFTTPCPFIGFSSAGNILLFSTWQTLIHTWRFIHFQCFLGEAFIFMQTEGVALSIGYLWYLCKPLLEFSWPRVQSIIYLGVWLPPWTHCSLKTLLLPNLPVYFQHLGR